MSNIRKVTINDTEKLVLLSTAVSINPCAYRGSYNTTVGGETKSYVFDPEARITSEYTLSKQTSTGFRGIKDYLESFADNTIKCVLHGYVIELDLGVAASGEDRTNLFVNLVLEKTDIMGSIEARDATFQAEAERSTWTTTSVARVLGGTTTNRRLLDDQMTIEGQSIKDYVFLGLVLTNEAPESSGESDSFKYYSLQITDADGNVYQPSLLPNISSGKTANSILLGEGLKAESVANKVAIGTYNEDGEYLFEVANGTADDQRHDVLAVKPELMQINSNIVQVGTDTLKVDDRETSKGILARVDDISLNGSQQIYLQSGSGNTASSINMKNGDNDADKKVEISTKHLNIDAPTAISGATTISGDTSVTGTTTLTGDLQVFKTGTTSNPRLVVDDSGVSIKDHAATDAMGALNIVSGNQYIHAGGGEIYTSGSIYSEGNLVADGSAQMTELVVDPNEDDDIQIASIGNITFTNKTITCDEDDSQITIENVSADHIGTEQVEVKDDTGSINITGSSIEITSNSNGNTTIDGGTGTFSNAMQINEGATALTAAETNVKSIDTNAKLGISSTWEYLNGGLMIGNKVDIGQGKDVDLNVSNDVAIGGGLYIKGDTADESITLKNGDISAKNISGSASVSTTKSSTAKVRSSNEVYLEDLILEDVRNTSNKSSAGNNLKQIFDNGIVLETSHNLCLYRTTNALDSSDVKWSLGLAKRLGEAGQNSDIDYIRAGELFASNNLTTNQIWYDGTNTSKLQIGRKMNGAIKKSDEIVIQEGTIKLDSFVHITESLEVMHASSRPTISLPVNTSDTSSYSYIHSSVKDQDYPRVVTIGNFNSGTQTTFALYDRSSMNADSFIIWGDSIISSDGNKYKSKISMKDGAIMLWDTPKQTEIWNPSMTSTQQPTSLKVLIKKDGSASFAGEVQARSFYATSDRRLKEHLKEYHAEKSILDLPVYKYDFIDGSKNNIGCLAQDLREICPEIVNEGSDGYLSINESKIVYLLLDEVKKLRKEVDELKSK